MTPKERVRALVVAALANANDDLARQELQSKRDGHIASVRAQHAEWLRIDREKVAELQAALEWVNSHA